MKQTITVRLEKGGQYYRVEQLGNRIEPTVGSRLDKYEVEALIKEAATATVHPLSVTVKA